MAYSEEELFNMSDDELDAAVAEERAELASPEVEKELDTKDSNGIQEDGLDQPADGADSADPELDDNNDDLDDDEEVPVDDIDNTDSPDNKDIETESKDAEPVTQEVAKRKFRANGQEFEFTEQEMIEQFGKVFGQSMNYTKKMQAISPYRKMISAFEDEGLQEQDMNLMIDALKGNKDAITSLLKRTDVDALDLDMDEESNYVPNDYGRNELELQLNEVIDTIKDDQEFAITQNVVSNQWDDRSRDTFANNPDLIKELHIDVQNGTYANVSPMATKLKVLDGGQRSDIEYYIEAGKQFHSQRRSAELQAEAQQNKQAKLEAVKAANDKRVQTKNASPSRKAATIPRKRVSEPKVTDYLDDTDEAFDEWYKKLEDSM